MRERDHLEGIGIDKGIILKWISSVRMGGWTGLICLRFGTGGRLL